MDQARLQTLLRYDPETGFFVWRSGNKINQVAGGQRKDGRRRIGLDGKRYLSSRLAWLYMTGAWPAGEIDHADRDKSNDIFSNLRDATKTQNLANRAQWRPGNFRGVRGLKGKWEAHIGSGQSYSYLGIHSTAEAAAIAYDKAALSRYGEFAQLNFQKDAPA